jgi:hypothetical protein
LPDLWPEVPLPGLPCWPVPPPLPACWRVGDCEDGLFPPEPETLLPPPPPEPCAEVAPPPGEVDLLAGGSLWLPPLVPPVPPPEPPTAVGGESVYCGGV